MIRCTVVALVTVLCIAAVASAQEDTCPEDVEMILDAVQDECAALNRNQVCYGNHRIDAETLQTSLSFSDIGDIIPVDQLATLRTYPLSLDDEEWGVAVLSVQANLPESLPGQNVTVIVFGDAEVQPDTNAPEDYQMPMQAFYLRTGIGSAACRAVPQGGVLVQNPRGTTVNLRINGFELRVGSTALFIAAETDELTVATLEGSVQVTVEGVTQDVPAGFTLTVTQETPPDTPAPAPDLNLLPANLLPEPVPQAGDPTGDVIGLFTCANNNGVDIAAGDDLLLRGGWADYELADVVAFATSNPPTLEYDGQLLAYGFRSGPSPWTDQQSGASGFVIHWFWAVPDVAPGTHQAIWRVGGETFMCEIRAQ